MRLKTKDIIIQICICDHKCILKHRKCLIFCDTIERGEGPKETGPWAPLWLDRALALRSRDRAAHARRILLTSQKGSILKKKIRCLKRTHDAISKRHKHFHEFIVYG